MGDDVTDGPKMRLLRSVYEKALDKWLEKCSYDAMAQAFPTIARDNPEALAAARNQLVEFIKGAAMEEFQMINEERSMQTKLNELDKLIEDAQRKVKLTLEAGGGNGNETDTLKTQPQPLRLGPDAVFRIKGVQAKRREIELLKARLAEATTEMQLLDEELAKEFEFAESARQFVDEASSKLVPRESLVKFEEELQRGRAEALAMEGVEQEF
ncbi:hypothetical protein HDV00_005150 [Rhizophlyctis rosea]|nr:hypothetical protein HDV00_005150 [Rhizophlyctis rosea]